MVCRSVVSTGAPKNVEKARLAAVRGAVRVIGVRKRGKVVHERVYCDKEYIGVRTKAEKVHRYIIYAFTCTIVRMSQRRETPGGVDRDTREGSSIEEVQC